MLFRSCRDLEARGVTYVRRSRLSGEPRGAPRALVVDVFGELPAWWGLAQIGFVGNSLTQHGGQNMIEPAAYGAAVLFGPNTRNFRESVQLLLSADGACVVQNAAGLTEAVRKLAAEKTLREAMGQRAQSAVAAHRGATERTLESLVPALTGTSRQPNAARAA